MAAGLAGRMGDASVVAIDRYYRDLSHLPRAERARQNFDHPDAIEWPLLEAHVAALRDGQAVALPVYDFAEHARCAATEACRSGEIVIVEGLFALVSPALRGLYDLAVYVDAPGDACLARRVERDVRERGRSPESVTEQWLASVEPMYVEVVAPTRRYADLVVAGAQPVNSSVDRIMRVLEADGK